MTARQLDTFLQTALFPRGLCPDAPMFYVLFIVSWSLSFSQIDSTQRSSWSFALRAVVNLASKLSMFSLEAPNASGLLFKWEVFLPVAWWRKGSWRCQQLTSSAGSCEGESPPASGSPPPFAPNSPNSPRVLGAHRGGTLRTELAATCAGQLRCGQGPLDILGRGGWCASRCTRAPRGLL